MKKKLINKIDLKKKNKKNKKNKLRKKRNKKITNKKEERDE